MPRPKVSDEHKHEVKKAANRRYYQRRREELIERAKQRYDPEAQRYNYMVNRDVIRAKDNQNRLLRQQREMLNQLHELREAVRPDFVPLVDFAITERFHEKLYPAELAVIESLLLLATQRAPPPENVITMPDAVDDNEADNVMDMTDDAGDIWMAEPEDDSDGETSTASTETKSPSQEESQPSLEPPRLIITEQNDFRDRDLSLILARPGSRCLSAIDFLYQG